MGTVGGTATAGMKSPGGMSERPAPGQAPQPARRILIVNAKGGCGKTTVATNLAGFYASQGRRIALLDYDPQGSSMEWLRVREKERVEARIFGVAAYRGPGAQMTRTWQLRMPPDTERVILDAPAGAQGHDLIELVRGIDNILIPVLPSPIDIHAAARFIQDLFLVAKVRARSIQVGVVANRIRRNTLVYQRLEAFLDSLEIPVVARLRDTHNYLHAASVGRSIHELEERPTERDMAEWQAVLNWIEEPGPNRE